MTRGMFRIVRGSVRDEEIGHNGRVRSFWYREGWFWVLDILSPETGHPYAPEGPFVSRDAATRHLRNTLNGRYDRRGARFVGWKIDPGGRRRALRPATKHLMLDRRLARQQDMD